jgi:integrase
MSSIKLTKAGTWTAQIDRKDNNGDRIRKKETFPTRALAETWANKQETTIATKRAGKYVAPEGTIGELVTRYVKDYSAARGGWSRAKQYNLDKIIDEVGHVEIKDWDKQQTIAYGKQIATTRGPVGTAERMNYLSKIFKIGHDHYEIETPVAAFASGMAVLRHLGVVGTTDPRDRQVERHEIETIKKHLGCVMQDVVDTLAIVPFRVSELCAVKWTDFDEVNRQVCLYRKDTSTKKKTFRKKVWVVLPEIETIRDGKAVTVDTFDLLFKRERTGEGPFAIEGTEASRQFSLAHKLAGIEDIKLHDLRSEAISSLLDQGFNYDTVAKLSGHNDLNVLKKHYDRRKPRMLHELFKRQIKINQQVRAAA